MGTTSGEDGLALCNSKEFAYISHIESVAGLTKRPKKWAQVHSEEPCTGVFRTQANGGRLMVVSTWRTHWTFRIVRSAL